MLNHDMRIGSTLIQPKKPGKAGKKKLEIEPTFYYYKR